MYAGFSKSDEDFAVFGLPVADDTTVSTGTEWAKPGVSMYQNLSTFEGLSQLDCLLAAWWYLLRRPRNHNHAGLSTVRFPVHGV